MAERIVKVIQPTIAPINQSRKQRAAAYCRVGTDSEDQSNSFSAQLKYYSDYIKSNADMEFVDIYADEGITGTCVAKRDEFKRMMKDASNGKLDRIFVKSVSRFARNSLECLESIRTLRSFVPKAAPIAAPKPNPIVPKPPLETKRRGVLKTRF